MSNNTPEEAASTEQEQSQQTPQQEQQDEQLGDGGKKALESERATRKELERQAKELAEKNSTYEQELSTTQEQLEELRAAKGSLERQLLVRDVVADKGLPMEFAERLRGDSREELEADADTLAGLIGSRRPAPVPEAGTSKPPKKSNGELFEDTVGQMFGR